MKTQYEFPRPYRKFGKCGYNVTLSDLPAGDDVGRLLRSRLYLFEDGQQIGDPHNSLDNVCHYGHGKYSHWKQECYFSTPDGGDPNINGRRYSALWSDELFFQERAVHFRTRLMKLLTRASLAPQDLAGKNILELGCGPQHGLSLIAAGYGANGVAVDSSAPPWDGEFHPGFLQYLIQHGGVLGQGFRGERLQPLLDKGSLTVSPLAYYCCDAETLATYTREIFDFHFSASRLGAYNNVEAVMDMLAETAGSGSIGFHGVDFRDGGGFYAQPLEHLLMTDAQYDEYCRVNMLPKSNRIRPKEMEVLWRKHGFTGVQPVPFEVPADPHYVDAFLPRLRASGTRFANEPEETLRQLVIIYVVRK